MWHQPWTYQIGYDRNGYRMESLQQQEENAQEIKAYCVAVCEELGLERVNTGDAWQIVRTLYEYDNLCARINVGENNAGDNYHDGDWGGGQYLNACVWFEVITGESCIGNLYRPQYQSDGQDFSLTEEMISMFQEAAHTAVTK